MGDRRPPSKLGDIQPDHWLAEYTEEHLNVLHVFGSLVELEPAQSELLDQICSGPRITAAELVADVTLSLPPNWRKSLHVHDNPLFRTVEDGHD